ncbi:hypothetical protein OA396_00650 [Candidatus Pelagibacter sp.]|nr:hypothetical protein [Candidatus Pelagibacter sp.]
MKKSTLNYLNKNYKKRKIRINDDTVLLNGGLNLDSMEIVNLILFIERQNKKKFQNKGYSNLFGIKLKDLLKFFK